MGLSITGTPAQFEVEAAVITDNSKNLMLFDQNKVIKQEYLSYNMAIQKARGLYVYIDLTRKPNSVESFSVEKILSLKSELKNRGLTAIFHGEDCLPLSHKVEEIRKAAVERVKKEIDLSAAFQAPLVTHGGQTHITLDLTEQRKEILNNLINSLKELSEYALYKGTELWIENLANHKAPPFFNVFSTHSEFSTVMESIPGLQMLYDIGHSNVNQGYLSEFFTKYFERIKALSLSDNNGHIDSHSKLGTGTVNFQNLIKDIKSTNWKGLLIFETRDCSLDEDLKTLHSFI